MMVGFAQQREYLLQEELQRLVVEFPSLGILKVWVTGEFASGNVTHITPLEFLVIQDTSEPYHRRADFFTDHLRPRVETYFHVFTPSEFDEYEDIDPFVRTTTEQSEPIFG